VYHVWRQAKLLGTPAYMAPETIDESQPFGAKIDIFAAGVTMCEICTHQLAWANENVWLVPSRVMSGDRPALPSHARYAALCALMRRCWSHSDTARPSARELSEALSDINGESRKKHKTDRRQ